MEGAFPFRLRRVDGSVEVQYGRNDDPERWGYGVLGMPWPMRLAEDLPVLDAAVTYDGDGYAAVMGWIQVVRITVSQASESLVPGSDKAPPGEHAWVDGPPQLKGLGVPFVSFGPRPALFDAPASTESDIRFVADSFLTASPDAVLSRVSQPCLGFRWGYGTKAGSAAELLPLSALDVGDWHEALPLLEREFPDWTFAKEWAD